VLEIPLLVENAAYYQQICHRVLVVEASEAIRIQRVQMRSQLSEAAILAIIHSQASDAQRQRLADDVIVNNQAYASLEQDILRLHGYYFALAEAFRLSS
jgi:dephospho-CoA kinase